MAKTIQIIQKLLDDYGAPINETNVPVSFLNKIYNIINRKETIDEENIDFNNSNFIGNVYLNGPTYQIYIDKIKEYYSNLNIYPTSVYIKFKDSVVEQILLNAGIGDGTGITYDAAASVTKIPSFKDNTDITSFDELKYFTNVKTLPDNGFSGCTNLESIDISNLQTGQAQTTFWYTFYNCSKLNNLGITEFPNPFHRNAHHTFQNCTSLGVGKDLELWYNETYTPGSATFRQTGYKKVIVHGAIQKAYPGAGESYAFYDMPNCEIKDFSDSVFTDVVGHSGSVDPNLVTLINPPTVNKVYWNSFAGSTNYPKFRHYVFLSNTVPSMTEGTQYWNFNNDTYIYVRDELVESYKTDSGWSTSSKAVARIKPLSELPSEVTWYTKDRDFSSYFDN